MHKFLYWLISCNFIFHCHILGLKFFYTLSFQKCSVAFCLSVSVQYKNYTVLKSTNCTFNDIFHFVMLLLYVIAPIGNLHRDHLPRNTFIINVVQGVCVCMCIYTGCNRRNGPDFGRVFFMLYYTDITQNTYVQSRTVTEIIAREKCGLHRS